MRLGINLPYTDSIPRELTLAYVQEADRLGFERVWVAEAYGFDAFTVLTEIACRTRRIGLATGIVNVFSRSPALIAQTAASLDVISGGRFTLGLGTSGHQVVAGWHGVPFEKGIARMRETMEIARTVWRREPLRHEGEVFQIPMGLRMITHPLRDRIPIHLATLTPKGVELAAEAADGWLPVFFSPAHFDRVLRPPLEAGARRAGRCLDDLEICVYQPVVVTGDRRAGREAARPHLALYIGGMGSRERNYYNHLFCRYGFEEEARRVQELYLAKRKEEAMAAITDEMIDAVTVIGTPGECREQLERLAAAGVDEVAMSLQVPDGDARAVGEALVGLAPR